MASLKVLIEKVSSTIITEASYASRTIAEYLTGLFSIPWRRFTTDVINLAESLTNLFGKNTQDGVNVSDQIGQIDFGKRPVDVINISEVVQSDFNKNTTDQLNLVENFEKGVGKNTSDQTNISDVQPTVDFEKGLSDSVNTTDDLNGAAVDDDQLVSYFKASDDQLNLTDNFSRDIQFFRDLIHQANISESDVIDFNKVVQDQFNVSESDVIEFGKNTQDILNFSDIFDRTIQFFREPTDSLNITDPLQSSFGKPFQHTTQLSDTAFVEMLFTVGLTDQLNVTDDINGAAIDDDQLVTFFKVSTEQINFSDQLDLVLLFDRTPTDQANISTTGLIVSQNYINGADYFSQDYVGVSRTIT